MSKLSEHQSGDMKHRGLGFDSLIQCYLTYISNGTLEQVCEIVGGSRSWQLVLVFPSTSITSTAQ